MIQEVAALDAATRAGFDAIIDVRSPSEFALDHVPGAVNLPVLSDAERAEVGTIYVQGSKFAARRIGAAYVSRNIAAHLTGALALQDGAFHPLVYCWRGGQRSAAMATVLSQVGWRVGLVRGGYRTWRRAVFETLYDDPAPLDVVLLRGPTGSGKTELLAHLAATGVQSLDLEGLAAHRGSVFGDLADTAQPSQKLFESRLMAALDRLDPARPVVVEDESSRIGDLRLPPRLWGAMKTAPCIGVDAPLEARVARIVADYGARLDRPDAVLATLRRLPPHLGHVQREGWAQAVRARDAAALARSLLIDHYDPAYARACRLHPGRALGGATLAGAGHADLAAAARQVAARLAARTVLAESGDGGRVSLSGRPERRGRGP